jgi:hypothetical protein
MRIIWRLSSAVCWLGFCLAPLLLCSCATRPPVRPVLPAEVSFNSGAGRGDMLLLTLRLADGEPRLFTVDTGLATTILDQSLELKLGKRLQTGLIWYGYFGPHSAGYYHAPALYLGGTRLLLGEQVNTDDLRFGSFAGRHLDGILGMDCLKRYCVQLDFQANKMRFLDPDLLATNQLGRAFPLTTFFGEVSAHADFFGVKHASLKLDTGDYTDGVLKAGLFEREWRERQRAGFTNQWQVRAGAQQPAAFFKQMAVFSQGAVGGETYDGLIMHECPLGMWLGRQNLLGLRFLARHLVTLNFPRRTLWLRRESAGPLPDDLLGLMIALGEMDGQPVRDATARFQAYIEHQPGGPLWQEANQFLEGLKSQGRLPGWAKSDRGYVWFDLGALFELQQEIRQETYPAGRTVLVHKNSSLSNYYYTVVRASRGSAWKLQRAWRTDAGGNLVEEYPVP